MREASIFATLRGIFASKPKVLLAPHCPNVNPPAEVGEEGVPTFALEQHLVLHEGYPIPKWDIVQEWVDGIDSQHLQAKAWTAIEQKWLLTMGEALGPQFALRQSDTAILLSSLDNKVAGATLDFIERTLGRVLKVLDGMAQVSPLGKELLIVFDDDDSYYRYISFYYPENGEYALSGGMHIDAGCSHYVTVKGDLSIIEPVIAHEMVHGCLGHLSLPTWLNEGLAVNTEHWLTGVRAAHSDTPHQLRGKHLDYWTEDEMQEFWSGQSFYRTDDGNLLAYDLARLMVERIAASNWEQFKAFVVAADRADAGQAAACEHLGIDLGEFVCDLLKGQPFAAWSPDARRWHAAGVTS